MKTKILLPVAIFYLVYIVAGGAIFHLFEYETEQNEISKVREDFNQWLEDHSQCVSSEELRSFIDEVLKEPDGSAAYAANVTEGANDWDFASSIFVAVTVVTTIGYGHLAPKTLEGQIFCVVFALFGIPLNLMVLGGLGAKLAHLMRKCRSKKMQSLRYHAIVRAIVITLVGTTIFTILPSLAFFFIEEWSYWESWYYSIITLSTIGFGDLVPGRNTDVDYRWWYRILVAAWINLGLAWLATLIGTISETMHHEISRISKKKVVEPCEEPPMGVIITMENRKEILELRDYGPRRLTAPHHLSTIDLEATTEMNMEMDMTDTDKIILDFNRTAGLDSSDTDETESEMA